MPTHFPQFNRKEIEAIMKLVDIMGISVAFMNNQGHITTEEVGFKVDSEQKIQKEDRFGAASLSKVVFAYLVLKLVQDKKLSLNEDLNAILTFGDFCRQENLPCAYPLRDIQLNIHSILSHTTGIDDSKDWIHFQTRPGNYCYSGIPLWYLQKVIEKKTEKTLEELAKQYVFSENACDMPHSTFDGSYPVKAANSLFTTAQDYAKFVKKWMKDEDPLLQSAFKSLVSIQSDDWAKAVDVDSETLSHLAWGTGWGLQLNDEGDVERTYHTGDMNNWRAFVAVDFVNKTAAVFFANSPNGLILAQSIIGKNVNIPHACNYVSEKYGFALQYEYDWKTKEDARFSKIQNYLESRSQPKLWPMPSAFFSRSAWHQMQNERKLTASTERAMYAFRKSFSKELYIKIAHDAYKHVLKKLPLGADNLESNPKRLQAANAIKKHRIEDDDCASLANYRDTRKKIKEGLLPKDFLILSEISQHQWAAYAAKAGNCGDQVAVALLYIIEKTMENKYPTQDISIAMAVIRSKGESIHEFLIIGKGEDAIVCDPHQEQIYPLANYLSGSFKEGGVDVAISSKKRYPGELCLKYTWHQDESQRECAHYYEPRPLDINTYLQSSSASSSSSSSPYQSLRCGI